MEPRQSFSQTALVASKVWLTTTPPDEHLNLCTVVSDPAIQI